MKRNYFVQFAVASFFIISLFGCGGGGSGSESNPSPVSPPPPVNVGQPSTQPAVVDIDSADVILIYSLSVPESLLQLADLVVSELNLTGLNELQSQTFLECSGNGGASVDLSDNNNDGVYNEGDVINLSFDTCLSSSIAARYFGEAVITLYVLGEDFSTLNIQWDGQTADSLNNTVDIEGEMEVIYDARGVDEVLLVRDDGDGINLVIEGSEEKIEEFSITKSINPVFDYAIDFDFTLSSSLLDGELECSSNSAVEGKVHAVPYKANVTCNGRNNGVLNLLTDITQTYDAFNDTNVNVTTSNGETFDTVSLLLEEIVEGSLGNSLLNTDFEKPEQQTIRSLNLIGELNDFGLMAYSESRRKIYIDGLSLEQQYISEIDVDTMQVTRTAYFDFPELFTSTFEMSEDGNSIYITFGRNVFGDDDNKLYELDIESFEIDVLTDYSSEVEAMPNDAGLAKSFVRSFTQAPNGDIFFILEIDQKFSPASKLFRVEDGEITYIEDLGVSPSSFSVHATEDLQIYLSDDRGISLYDISSGSVELVTTKEIPDEDGVVRTRDIVDEYEGKLYSSRPVIIDWEAERVILQDIRPGIYGTVDYFPPLDTVFRVLNGVETHSISKNKQVTFLQTNGSANLPNLDFGKYLFVEDEYLVIAQRNNSSSANNDISLVRIPFNLLF